MTYVICSSSVYSKPVYHRKVTFGKIKNNLIKSNICTAVLLQQNIKSVCIQRGKVWNILWGQQSYNCLLTFFKEWGRISASAWLCSNHVNYWLIRSRHEIMGALIIKTHHILIVKLKVVVIVNCRCVTHIKKIKMKVVKLCGAKNTPRRKVSLFLASRF